MLFSDLKEHFQSEFSLLFTAHRGAFSMFPLARYSVAMSVAIFTGHATYVTSRTYARSYFEVSPCNHDVGEPFDGRRFPSPPPPEHVSHNPGVYT